MILDGIEKILSSHPLAKDIDEISVGVLDFNNGNSSKFVFESNGEKFFSKDQSSFYDLASLTKPFTIGLLQFLYPEFVKKNDVSLLLSHRSGIPAWGLLSNYNWRDQISSYPITKSDTLYSDFGAIRAQLEFEKEYNQPLYDSVSCCWNDNIIHWSQVNKDLCLNTGERGYKKIKGDVHDPNAWVIKEKVSHAGLFATLDGLVASLFKLEDEFSFTDYFYQLITQNNQRFIHGWDTVTDKSETLAGHECGDYLIGHLGFTGTSVWVDCQSKLGAIILSNATRDGWYNKKNLNYVRRTIGNYIWKLR